MFRELLLSAEGKPSATLPKRANGAGKTRSAKSSAHSAKTVAAKRKRTAKRAKPSRPAAVKRGRPMQYTDKTVVRMPKGWLKALNAKASKAGMGQGAYLRNALCRSLTGKKPTAALR